MNTIFDNLSKNVDLSIFDEGNKDPKTPLRRRYLALVGLLEYVDILNGDLPGRSLPEGMTSDDVKRMVSHVIGDLDTMKAMSTDGSLPEHNYVDLGLPSGTLWATENIKDTAGNEMYFAWGETHGYIKEQVGKEEGKRAFSWDDYEFGKYDSEDITNYGMKKYNKTDELTVLEPKDDAAIVNWGEGWKMPTPEQFKELRANTEYEWTEINGVPGGKFTSTVEGYTDKFLFFPAASYIKNGAPANLGVYGVCWLNFLNNERCDNVWYFHFMKSGMGPSSDGVRCLGCSIRPVRAQNI